MRILNLYAGGRIMKVHICIKKDGNIVFERNAINLDEISSYKDTINILCHYDSIKYDLTLNTQEQDYEIVICYPLEVEF